MRWYINDASLQGQYNNTSEFLALLQGLLVARNRSSVLKASLHITRSFAIREVNAGQTLRSILANQGNQNLQKGMMIWLDRTGPFVDDDRHPELDDYFEYMGYDVTDTGLGEAARHIKAGAKAKTFSFPGGPTEYGLSPLSVDHGLAEERFGTYEVENLWLLETLSASALAAQPDPANWRQLVTVAREHFPRLNIPDCIYTDAALAREPFDAVIRDRTMALLKHLDDYMVGRNVDGSEGPDARAVVDSFFTGDRALFSGESQTNQVAFKEAMTFKDPADPNQTIFGHWHGKISHRHFRLHFEWPVHADATDLKILYLGPKITQS